MAKQEMVDLLIQLHALCGTIEEGAAYLEEHPDDAQVKREIQAGAAFKTLTGF